MTPEVSTIAISVNDVQASVVEPRGIYVYSEHLTEHLQDPQYAQQLTQALTVRGVDGLTLLLGWEVIEPSRGAYDWTLLDHWMSMAVSSGKQVALAIRAGQDTPCWLFQSPECGAGYTKSYAGAAPLRFLVSPHAGVGESKCNSETIAAPWEPIFLSEWDSMLAAVAAHLKSTGTYSALTSVRITGIDRTTSELRLPAEILADPCVTNSLEAWLKATPPYRPSRLLDAWDKLTNSFQRNFPDKYFGVEVIPTPSEARNLDYPFPAIDDNGCAYQPPWPKDRNNPNYVTGVCLNTSNVTDQNAPLLALASRKFAGRLSVSFQWLDFSSPASPYVVYAAQTWRTMIGFQTNDLDKFERAACSGSAENPGLCDSKTYLALLEVGIYPLGKTNSLRANYIEALPPDAIAFPDAIQQAHLELVPPQPTSTQTASSKTSTSILPKVTSSSSPTSVVPPMFSIGTSMVILPAVLVAIVIALTLIFMMKRKKPSG